MSPEEKLMMVRYECRFPGGTQQSSENLPFITVGSRQRVLPLELTRNLVNLRVRLGNEMAMLGECYLGGFVIIAKHWELVNQRLANAKRLFESEISENFIPQYNLYNRVGGDHIPGLPPGVKMPPLSSLIQTLRFDYGIFELKDESLFFDSLRTTNALHARKILELITEGSFPPRNVTSETMALATSVSRWLHRIKFYAQIRNTLTSGLSYVMQSPTDPTGYEMLSRVLEKIALDDKRFGNAVSLPGATEEEYQETFDDVPLLKALLGEAS